MKNLSLWFLLVILLASCDPYKRMVDYCQKYPDRCTKTTKDSIIIRESKYDTLLSYSFNKDSVFYYDSASKTYVHKYYFKDSFWTTLKSAPCTTRLVQNIVSPLPKEKGHDYTPIWYIAGTLVLIGFIRWILK